MANITQSCRSLEPKHPRARLFISEVVKAVILAIRLFCLCCLFVRARQMRDFLAFKNIQGDAERTTNAAEEQKWNK